MAVNAVQEALRAAFGRWGCPGQLRVDNGHPWGATGGLPTALALWAAGLGVPTHHNRPHCPQSNGVVESSQGVTQRWVEAASCADLAQLRQRVAEEDQVQRECYPAILGQSRRAAYPGLLHTGRGYCRQWEEMVWDVGEALRYLSARRVRRKVSPVGKVSLYNRMVMVGRGWAGQRVEVQLAVADGAPQWVVSTSGGQEIRRRPAPGLSQEEIVALRVARA